MPLNKEQLFAHLKASAKGTSKAKPALPKTPAIKQAEKIEHQAKKAVSKVEQEVTSHTGLQSQANNLELPQVESTQDARVIAEASLSPALVRKPLSGEKLSTNEQKAVAAVCKQVGFL